MFHIFTKKPIISLLLAIILVTTTASLNKTHATVTKPAKQSISNQTFEDTSPPFIIISNIFDGEIVTEPELTIEFIVFDDTSVKEIFVNGTAVPISEDEEYFHDLILLHGENLISITATDSNGNTSSAELTVEFLLPEELEGSEEDFEDFDDEFGDIFEDFEDVFADLEEFIDLTVQLIEELTDKIIVSIAEEFANLNEAIIDQFNIFTEGLGEVIDIAQTVSVEIANAPAIAEGLPAIFELPEFESIDFFEDIEEIFEIPKGFSFATDIFFEDFSEPVIINEEDLSDQNAAVLVDADGKTFVVGFAFFKETDQNFSLKKHHRFQTESGDPIELTTTITIPADAAEGNANVSILNNNESLATIPLRVTPPREVKVKNRQIGKPQIIEPINAIVEKSGKELVLKIKGKNFIQKIATIDGQLQRLTGKVSFTNVTFVPSEGIKIKSTKVRKNSITVKAKIKGNIEPGIKLFNVITPKGADIGAIVFPEDLKSGKLETSVTPEDLILNN